MLMLVQSLVRGSSLDSTHSRHKYIMHSTVISINILIELAFLAVISIGQLDTPTG